MDEPEVLAVLLVKYLRSDDDGASRHQHRPDANGLHSRAAHVWFFVLRVDLKVDMSDLEKVEGDKLDQRREEAESEENLHRQVQIFIIYDLLLVIVPS